jgi:hypothetical protein
MRPPAMWKASQDTIQTIKRNNAKIRKKKSRKVALRSLDGLGMERKSVK